MLSMSEAMAVKMNETNDQTNNKANSHLYTNIYLYTL